jgi:hypothetical protein
VFITYVYMAPKYRFGTHTSGERMTLDQTRARAEKAFKQEERERDGNAAMAEYQADLIALRERTARLKALRLAKQAETPEAPARAENDRRTNTRK